MKKRLTRQQRFRMFIDYFVENMPVAETELHYKSPYELLVAVILSAQCTDKRVNIITPAFYARFPDALALSIAEYDAVYELIKSCSYPNNKTRNLIGMAKGLVDQFNSIVPSDISDLQRLPGVGRKTANVIASVVFNKPAMAVDTHVFRVAARIGLTENARNPYQAEMQLVEYIPGELIPNAHHWLILHGRYVCKSRKPDCLNCGLKTFCRFYAKNYASEAIKTLI